MTLLFFSLSSSSLLSVGEAQKGWIMRERPVDEQVSTIWYWHYFCILLHNKQFLSLKENDSEYGQQKWRRTYLSNVAASMYFPLGENFTNDTGGLSSSGREDMNNPVITPNDFWLQEGRGGSRIFLGGGALVSCSTSTPINHIVFFFRRIPVVLENGRSP